MTVLLLALGIICIAQAMRIHRVNRQLSEWSDYLQNVQNFPEQKCFVKGNGSLAKINFQINDILEKNRQQLTRLTNAEEANKQILTNLSHDVRTPLASLIGYLEALEQERVTEDGQKEYCRIAYQKALDLKELVDILFEWFKINAAEQEYHMEDCDVNELTRQIIIGYLPIVESRDISLEVQISEEEYFVTLDRLAYERIINNLLGNALKHAECSKLTVRTHQSNGSVVIETANDGLPIPKEEIPYLFDRLYKCDAARSQSGSGLGLAIVKELVTAMHGKVTAESLPGKTSFYLSFPLSIRKR